MNQHIAYLRLICATALCFLLALGGAGCASLADPSSFASVTIANRSEAEIMAATANVFSAGGYHGSASGAGQMVFEKGASQATTLAREGVLAIHYGGQTIERVRVQVVSLGAESFRLQCKAYMVKGGTDPFFQDEVPLANVRSGPYQMLLDQAKNQLK